MRREISDYNRRCNRMNEFYDWEELDEFIRETTFSGIDPKDAMSWLERNTLYRFTREPDKPLYMKSMLLEYIISFNKESKDI